VFPLCLLVGGEVEIRSRRYDEKCNGDESLFSIPSIVASRPGRRGSERAFICAHSTGPLMYSTGKGTLSNVEARGSARVSLFAYVRSFPDCSVLGQCSCKPCAFPILTL